MAVSSSASCCAATDLHKHHMDAAQTRGWQHFRSPRPSRNSGLYLAAKKASRILHASAALQRSPAGLAAGTAGTKRLGIEPCCHQMRKDF
eukprot:s3298_g5.t1